MRGLLQLYFLITYSFASRAPFVLAQDKTVVIRECEEDGGTTEILPGPSTAATIIKSFNFSSGHYRNSEDCQIQFWADSQPLVLSLTFNSFDVEAEPKCQKDYLCINGVHFCGSWEVNKTFTFKVPANRSFTLRFVTDATVSRRGFEITAVARVTNEHAQFPEVSGGYGSAEEHLFRTEPRKTEIYRDRCFNGDDRLGPRNSFASSKSYAATTDGSNTTYSDYQSEYASDKTNSYPLLTDYNSYDTTRNPLLTNNRFSEPTPKSFRTDNHNYDNTSNPHGTDNLNYNTSPNSLQTDNINYDTTPNPLQKDNPIYDTSSNSVQSGKSNYDTTHKNIISNNTAFNQLLADNISNNTKQNPLHNGNNSYNTTPFPLHTNNLSTNITTNPLHKDNIHYDTISKALRKDNPSYKTTPNALQKDNTNDTTYNPLETDYPNHDPVPHPLQTDHLSYETNHNSHHTTDNPEYETPRNPPTSDYPVIDIPHDSLNINHPEKDTIQNPLETIHLNYSITSDPQETHYPRNDITSDQQRSNHITDNVMDLVSGNYHQVASDTINEVLPTSVPVKTQTPIIICNSYIQPVSDNSPSSKYIFRNAGFGSRPYYNNEQCSVEFRTASTARLFTIKFISLDLESHPSCDFDSICVGGVRFCESSETGHAYRHVVPAHQTFTLAFISDISNTGAGFEVEVDIQDAIQSWGRHGAPTNHRPPLDSISRQIRTTDNYVDKCSFAPVHESAVTSTHDTTVDNYQGTTVDNYQGTTVDNYQGTTIYNYQGTTVDNYQSTTVDNYQGTTVDNYQGTTVDNYQSTTVDNYQGTTVDNYQSTTVDNYQGTTVDNYQGTTVDNYQGTTVDNYQGTTVDNYQGTTVGNYQGTTVDHYQGTTVDHYQGTTVDNYQGTTKDNYQGTTVDNYQGTTLDRYQSTSHSSVTTQGQYITTDSHEITGNSVQTEQSNYQTPDKAYQTTDKVYQTTDKVDQITDKGYQTTETMDNAYQTTDKSYQTADNGYVTKNKGYQTTDSRYQKTDSKYQTTDSRHQTTNSGSQTPDNSIPDSPTIDDIDGRKSNFSEPTHHPWVKNSTIYCGDHPSTVNVSNETSWYIVKSGRQGDGTGYANNERCLVVYGTPNVAKMFTVAFKTFDIEYQKDCCYDYLCVKGVKYCGDWATGHSFRHVVPANSTFTLAFSTDESKTGRGFEIHIAISDPPADEEVLEVFTGVGSRAESLTYKASNIHDYTDMCQQPVPCSSDHLSPTVTVTSPPHTTTHEPPTNWQAPYTDSSFLAHHLHIILRMIEAAQDRISYAYDLLTSLV